MDEPKNHTNLDAFKVNPLDYLIILAKYSRMIISVSVAGTILIYLYLFCSPNIYKAKARMLPPQQNLTLSAQILDSLGGRMAPGAGGTGGMAASFLGLTSPSDLYVTMLTSERVLDRVIGGCQLMKLFKIKGLEDARVALRNNAKISAGKKDGGIIVIETVSKTPKLAAEIANSFVEALDWLLQDLANQEAKGRLAFLEKERLQANQNLAKAEESVRLFSETNSVLQIDTQTKGTIEYVARLRAEIDAKEVQIQVLRYQATPRNSEMIRMEMEIKGLKERLHSAETQMENCVSDVCLPTSKAPGLGLEYLRLFREAKFQESLYQLYTKVVEVARLDMARNVTVVQVLAPATPPENRANSRLKPSMVAGMLIFLMMIGVAFGLEYMQNNNEDDVHRLTLLKGYLAPWANIVKRINNIIRI